MYSAYEGWSWQQREVKVQLSYTTRKFSERVLVSLLQSCVIFPPNFFSKSVIQQNQCPMRLNLELFLCSGWKFVSWVMKFNINILKNSAPVSSCLFSERAFTGNLLGFSSFISQFHYFNKRELQHCKCEVLQRNCMTSLSAQTLTHNVGALLEGKITVFFNSPTENCLTWFTCLIFLQCF